jgi:hypothetical protein
MTIHTEAAELFHADGQTDITTMIVAFRNFANALKNAVLYISLLIPYTTSYGHPNLRK